MVDYPQCEWHVGTRHQGRCWRPAMTKLKATHKDWTEYERALCNWHKEELIFIRSQIPLSRER